jgi:hypothetical protein
MGELVIGLAATKGPWSIAFRSYVRDHTQGITIEVLMDRFGLSRASPRLDALVVDDVMRTFSAPEIAGAQQVGIHVVGLYDGTTGMGRQYLINLGADAALPAATPPADLVAHILEHRPRRSSGPGTGTGHRIGVARTALGRRSRERSGLVSAWTKVSGGAGLTEVIVAAAEHLGRKGHVLVIEADEVAPVLASRLLRSPDPGLAWAVSRAAQGLKVLPEGLSGTRGDGTVAVGSFDVICGTAGAAQVIPAADLLRLIDEGASAYDHVLVETSWLVGAPSSRERFSATRAVLATADRALVLASADPEGAARLVEWRAAALAAGCKAPSWAAFGRARGSRYERGHLADLLRANTGRHPFEDVWFLPEDATVARARWNAEVVWKGPWLKATRALTDAVSANGPGHVTARPAPRPPLAGLTLLTDLPADMVTL